MQIDAAESERSTSVLRDKDKSLQQVIKHLVRKGILRGGLAGALAKRGDTLHINHLLAVLNSRLPSPITRVEVASALAWIGDAHAVDTLLQIVKDKTEDINVRCASLLALTWFADRRVNRVVGKILRDRSEDCYLRAEAASALAYVDHSNAIELLIGALSEDDNEIRYCAAEALAYRANDQLLGNRATAALTQSLKDNDNRVRDYAAIALGTFKILVEIIENREKASSLRIEAIKTLAKGHDERSIAPLVQVLQDLTEKGSIRCASAEALSYFGGKRAIDALISSLKDGNSKLCAACAESLGWLIDIEDYNKRRKRQVLDELIMVLGDENTSVRSSVVEALGRIGDPHALPALLSLQTNNSSENNSLPATINRAIANIQSRMVEESVDKNG
ncbi:MAG TPA: HEAT repeat domain-containing protein [Chloroflexia bacterium]|jgi:HEAT repeat protein